MLTEALRQAQAFVPAAVDIHLYNFSGFEGMGHWESEATYQAFP